jgi:nucleoside-diphosphate-sugar epimerase
MGIMGTRSQFLSFDRLRMNGKSNHVPTIPPVTRETIDKYIEDVAVDGSLIQRELGFAPQYDLKAGWEETIREMRESGAL